MSGDHRSIGEVLALLREEFPDITISKIRFLESQGLIRPERTPSGYRKFYEADVERLRWILRQQKEHYLPLKVIRRRLAELEEQLAVQAASESSAGALGEEGTGARSGARSRRAAAVTTAGEPVPEEGTGDGEGRAAERAVESGVAFRREELARAVGIEESVLEELERFGLLRPTGGSNDEALYDDQAVVVARLARGFLRHGVEPRHLRMYKTFAEREAGFVSQLVMPLLKQKNPEARRRARETVAELSRLGSGLRAAMLREALRGALDE